MWSEIQIHIHFSYSNDVLFSIFRVGKIVNMIKIAILEDDDSARNTLISFLRRYSEEKNEEIAIDSYGGSFEFLEKYHHDADLILFDIEMPGLSGMDVAKKVRENDKHTIIVFVTNLAQYAIEGYSVNAFDFLLKPVNYSSFVLKLDRVFNEIHHHKDEAFITFTTKNGIMKLDVNDISYVEVKNHDVIYHSLNNQYKVRSTMTKAAEELSSYHFELCNACYLVNLKYVSKIENNMVKVGEDRLMISQSKRKSFLSAVAKYLGGTE